MIPVLSVHNVTKEFGGHRALDDVSFELDPGTTLGVVGESGSGKSTLGRIALRLLEPTEGQVWLDGVRVNRTRGQTLKRFRQAVQLVPQDPRHALNPTMTVAQNLYFHLQSQGVARRHWRERVATVLDQVGLSAGLVDARPYQLSGGQAQRVAIARAISNEPRVLVCDEAVSALDKSVQAQVLNTLATLQQRTRVAIFFISHDIAVVEHISDRILVLHRGHVVESGDVASVMAAPRDEYTRHLLATSQEHHTYEGSRS